MKTLLRSVTCLALSVFLSAAASAQLGKSNPLSQAPPRRLTNADIIQMVDEGMPDNLILQMIEQSETQFDTSPNSVIQLHDGGVSLRVIEAMQKASQNGPPAASAPLTPIQQVASFTVALDGCNAGGTTVTCYFTVTNNGNERKLFLYAHGSRLAESSGRKLVGGESSMNDIQGTIQEMVAFSNVAIKGWVKFIGVQPSSRKSLSLHFYASPPGSFDVQFNDISIAGAGDIPLTNVDTRPKPAANPQNRPQQIEGAVRSGRRILDTVRGRRP